MKSFLAFEWRYHQIASLVSYLQAADCTGLGLIMSVFFNSCAVHLSQALAEWS